MMTVRGPQCNAEGTPLIHPQQVSKMEARFVLRTHQSLLEHPET